MAILNLLGVLLFGKSALRQARLEANIEWERKRIAAEAIARNWEAELSICKMALSGSGLKEWQLQYLILMAETAITLHAEKYQLTQKR